MLHDRWHESSLREILDGLPGWTGGPLVVRFVDWFVRPAPYWPEDGSR